MVFSLVLVIRLVFVWFSFDLRSVVVEARFIAGCVVVCLVWFGSVRQQRAPVSLHLQVGRHYHGLRLVQHNLEDLAIAVAAAVVTRQVSNSTGIVVVQRKTLWASSY